MSLMLISKLKGRQTLLLLLIHKHRDADGKVCDIGTVFDSTS